MRALIAHNRYRSSLPSGENAVVEREIAGLTERGVVVDRLAADSDDIDDFGPWDRLTLPLRPTWSAEAHRRFRSLVDADRPDVVHLHNPYPLLSPAVVRWAGALDLPVVQTVHNVRHACLAGTFVRDGEVCRRCAGRRVPWPGVVHGCYRGARGPSLALAVAHTAHRGTWQQVDRFVAVSRYIAGELVSAGLPADRITVRPNGIPDPGPTPPPGSGVLFAGRLGPEKGIDLLLAVWADRRLRPPTTLRIAGDGPARAQVQAAAAADPAIEYLGLLDRPAMRSALADTAMVAMPSRQAEAQGLVAVEALAHGRAVVGSTMGAIPEMVDESVGAVAPTDPRALAEALAEVLADAASRGVAARDRYLDRYTVDRALDGLVAVYEDAVG